VAGTPPAAARLPNPTARAKLNASQRPENRQAPMDFDRIVHSFAGNPLDRIVITVNYGSR